MSNARHLPVIVGSLSLVFSPSFLCLPVSVCQENVEKGNIKPYFAQ